MRAYIVIGTLAVLALSAGICAADTQIEKASPGYKWAEQRGGAASEVDNGIGTPLPLSPDDGGDDDDN